MKLSEWARWNGVHDQAAWWWARDGNIPVPVVKTVTGRYLVLWPGGVGGERTVVYCQVSSAGRKADLKGRRARLLRDRSVTVVVVEHRDRLTRFGFEHLQVALGAAGRRIEIVDDVEVDDLVRDITEVMPCLRARLYERRSASRRAKASLASVRDVA